MQYKRLDFFHLRNPEQYHFFTEFRTLFEKQTHLASNVQELFHHFCKLLSEAKMVEDIILKSSSTDIMIAADAARDTVLRGLLSTIQSAHQHFNEEKRQAASHLQAVFDRYGNLADLPYTEETHKINTLIHEIRDIHIKEIEILNMFDWLKELERTNSHFEKLVEGSTVEVSRATELHVVELRRKVVETYRKIILRIEALSLVDNSTYSSFFPKLEILINYYAKIITQRQGLSMMNN